MRYEMIDDEAHIYVENTETELGVLRSVAKASFELATSVGSMQYNETDQLTNQLADRFITLKNWRRNDLQVVLSMDYVKGRQCKTVVEKTDDGHFILFRSFSMRGSAEEMLKKAKDILSNEPGIDLIVPDEVSNKSIETALTQKTKTIIEIVAQEAPLLIGIVFWICIIFLVFFRS